MDSYFSDFNEQANQTNIRISSLTINDELFIINDMAKRRRKKPGPKQIAYGRVSISLGRGQRNFLDEQSELSRVSVASLVRNAIDDLINRGKAGAA